MRTLAKNKQTMYYALLIGEMDEYEYDDEGKKIPIYTDSEGVVHYKLTGEKVLAYSHPIEFKANFSMSGGEVEAESFGLSIADYDAVIVPDRKVPISETSIVWKNTTPTMKNEDYADETTADFKVVKKPETLNVTKFVLKAIVK